MRWTRGGVARAAAVLAAAVITADAARACSGLQTTGCRAHVTARPNRLAVTFEVANTSTAACRVFAAQDTTAVDNGGHSWLARPSSSNISGVWVCDRGAYCLTQEKDVVERSATIIEPGKSMVVVLTFAAAESERRFGDLLSVGFVLTAQTVVERATPSSPSRIEGGAWRSVSVGSASCPLKTN